MRISRNSPLVAPITGTALKQLKFSLTKIHPQQVLRRMCQHTPQVYDLKIKLICSPTLKVLITKSSQVYLHTIVFKASLVVQEEKNRDIQGAMNFVLMASGVVA